MYYENYFCEINKTRKAIKIKRRKEKGIRKKKYKEWGVSAQFGGFASSLAHSIPGLFDFLALVCGMSDQCTWWTACDGHQIEASGCVAS